MPRKLLLAGILIVACATVIIYYPGLVVGFMGDDWDFLRLAIQTPTFELIRLGFDPFAQFIWYRPLIRTVWAIDYVLFGVNPVGYHAIALLFHLGNCLLLFALVKRLTNKSRVGIVASVVYAGFSLASQAVFWPSDAQIIATFFFLLALTFWISFLQKDQKRDYTLALLFATLALLSKETSITIIIVLFLVDRLLIRKSATWLGLFRRYAPFALLTFAYVILTYRIATQGIFPKQMGYGLGTHILYNLTDYLALLVFPWNNSFEISYVWLAVVVLCLAWFVRRGQAHSVAFLVLSVITALLPVLLFPRTDSGYAYLNPRYAYFPLMVSATSLALALEWIWHRVHVNYAGIAIPIGLTLLVFVNGLNTMESSTFWAETSRLERLPFRNIATRHPTFPQDTILYFIDAYANYWSGMFLARYGTNVTVSDVHTLSEARLRNHKNAIILTVNEQGDSQEIAVDQNISITALPDLPITFDAPIRLENYELASARLQRGDTLALILYWRTIQKIDKDYTVFVHLVDSNGQVIDGYDSQPRGGKAPTSHWTPNELMPDGILLHIPSDAPIGKSLRLEIGLYDLSTMQRPAIVDASGNAITDTLVLTPIQITD